MSNVVMLFCCLLELPGSSQGISSCDTKHVTIVHVHANPPNKQLRESLCPFALLIQTQTHNLTVGLPQG